jgi:translation elongation factor EF-Tu-like GTPase
MQYHVIEAEIRYLTAEEGGRRSAVASGYRGQFHYGGEDYDGFQYFPDTAKTEAVELGKKVRAFVAFLSNRWEEVHRGQLAEGMPIEIREGSRIAGQGLVTRLNVDEAKWRGVIGEEHGGSNG